MGISTLQNRNWSVDIIIDTACDSTLDWLNCVYQTLEDDFPVCCASPGVPDQPSLCGRKNLPKQCFGSLRDRFLPCYVDGDIDAPMDIPPKLLLHFRDTVLLWT